MPSPKITFYKTFLESAEDSFNEQMWYEFWNALITTENQYLFIRANEYSYREIGVPDLLDKEGNVFFLLLMAAICGEI